MTRILHALVWAAAIIAVAIAAQQGLIADQLASWLVILIPGLAVVALGLTSCRSGKQCGKALRTS